MPESSGIPQRTLRALALTVMVLASGFAGGAAARDDPPRSTTSDASGSRVDGDDLVLRGLRALTSAPPLPRVHPPTGPSSIDSTLAELIDAHRAYIAESPERFAAIAHLSAVAARGRADLAEPLLSRHRTSTEAALEHFRLLAKTGTTTRSDEELNRTACLLVDAMNGIELTHLEDPHPDRRPGAYRELRRLVAALLTA